MIHFKHFITLAILLPLGAWAAPAHDTAASTIADVTPYVYPDNQAKTPEKMVMMPDGLSYLTLSDDGKHIDRCATATGDVQETVLNVEKTRENSIDHIEDFILSPDGKKLLVYSKKEMIWRHSFEANWHTFDIYRNILKPLSTEFAMQQAPAFSPDGRMVAFVAGEGNIYIKKLDYDSQVAVTKDGKKGEVINGVPDWVYQEEFGLLSTLTWAPDNSGLCYVKFNEADVPVYTFTLYQGACKPNDQYALYPGQFSYKYPVAGEPNSKATVHHYDVETRETKRVDLPYSSFEYIPRITYAGNAERLMVVTLNRDQNRMDIYSCNPKSTVAKAILSETDDAWIEPDTYEAIRWGEDSFVLQSYRSGWCHLYQYAYTGSLIRQLTSGDFNVTAYYGADAQGAHYYQATSQGPLNRQVRRLDTKSGKSTDLSPVTGWADLQGDPAKGFYSIKYSSAEVPPRYTLYNTKQKQLRVLEANDSLQDVVAKLPRKEFFTMESDGVTLNGYMIKPQGVSGKAPVIMWQYSGPGSQEVKNQWSVDWQVAASQAGIGVICVDGRGTGGRERSFTTSVYRRLGYYETIDQRNAARYIASLPWVDASCIGIAGWSYGGFETLMAATADASGMPQPTYAAAVAIAPVTDWRYYDSIYTERYMLTPAQNHDGYELAPTQFTDRLDCPLLIMHGTSDDNVHIANSFEYTARLVENAKSCYMMPFTGMDHSIRECGARAVVYGTMLHFFKQNLQATTR